MNNFKKKIRALASIVIVLTILMVSGMVVRNIHHPYFSNIRKPVLFVVDLPKELIRIFMSGLETNSPRLPNSIKDHQTDFEFISDGFYYYKNKTIYHSKRDTILTKVQDPTGILHIAENEEYFYEFKDRSIFKKCTRKVKNSQCKDWIIDVPYTHHETYVDQEGYIYSPAYNPVKYTTSDNTVQIFAQILQSNGAPPYGVNADTYRDDSILVISPKGKIIYDHSLTNIFSTNEMKPYIYAFGLETDPFHLNSVYPAKKDYELIKKGDLLLSMRHMSMLMIYRPSTKKVIWYKIGPWSNQHSAKFDLDGNIYLFDNNLIETHYNRRRENGYIDGHNRLLKIDIATKQISEFEKCLPFEDVNTLTGGKINKKNNSLQVFYTNSATGMLCDISTGKKTYFKPHYTASGRTIQNTGFKFLQFSE